jgi:hypothetical protein
MFYSYAITVTNSTTEASPKVTTAKVTHGVVTRVSFRPRPGHSGLCHAKVFYHEHQLFPTDREEDLHGDTFPIEWDEYEELFTPPFELVVKAWNEDTAYSHTFDISFAILPEKIVAPQDFGQLIKDILGYFSPRRIFGGGG